MGGGGGGGGEKGGFKCFSGTGVRPRPLRGTQSTAERERERGTPENRDMQRKPVASSGSTFYIIIIYFRQETGGATHHPWLHAELMQINRMRKTKTKVVCFLWFGLK